jgi:GNAT superfamily N-acetyltransferase
MPEEQVTSTMGLHQSVEIGMLREADLLAALQIQEAEHWNQCARDWKRLLALNPAGCFGAFSAGKLVGTVTVITYGRRLAWIGMMLVAPEYRDRGIGKRLMYTALGHCQQQHVRTIKLDATPAGRSLYESLGFIAECEIERWQGWAALAKAKPLCETPGNKSLHPAIDRLDGKAFYAPRKGLLHALLLDCCVRPALEMDDSGRELLGYALARSGSRASYAGPIVAVEQGVAVRLFDSLLESLAEEVFVDICVRNADFVASLVKRGFAKQRSLTRMTLGQPSLSMSDMVFAIAGPELG